MITGVKDRLEMIKKQMAKGSLTVKGLTFTTVYGKTIKWEFPEGDSFIILGDNIIYTSRLESSYLQGEDKDMIKSLIDKAIIATEDKQKGYITRYR